MARKQIEDLIEELRSWLPNYDARSDKDYPVLLFRILASLPGGDELEDMGYETFNLGWHEADQLGRLLEAIQDKRDVEDLVRGLVYEEEEDISERRRSSRSRGIQIGDRVKSGRGEDADTGVVHQIKGSEAFVGWDSGVRTWASLKSLRPTEEHWSGGHRIAARRRPTTTKAAPKPRANPRKKAPRRRR